MKLSEDKYNCRVLIDHSSNSKALSKVVVAYVTFLKIAYIYLNLTFSAEYYEQETQFLQLRFKKLLYVN